MTRVLVAVLLLASLATRAGAQEMIPSESLANLQEMFGSLRDHLWEVSDGFWHEGQYERCIATTRLIAEIDPRDVEAWEGSAFLLANQLRDDEAEALLLEGIAYNSDCYDLYFELGYFYYMRERFDEAVYYLELADSFDKPFFVTHSLAHAYEHAGRSEDSLCIWLQREAEDPTSPVPKLQIERILTGGPMSNVPRFMSRAREERRQKELEQGNPRE